MLCLIFQNIWVGHEVLPSALTVDKMFIDYYSFVFNSFIFYFNDFSSGVSKQHSYNVAAKAGPSRVIDDKNNDSDKNDDDGESERHCKTIVALPVR